MLNKFKRREKLDGSRWERGGERPPARKLAFSSSPSAGGETLIGRGAISRTHTVCFDQIRAGIRSNYQFIEK